MGAVLYIYIYIYNMYACMHACMYVYAYAYVYAYVYVCVWDPNKGPNSESSLNPPGRKNQPLYPRPNTLNAILHLSRMGTTKRDAVGFLGRP